MSLSVSSADTKTFFNLLPRDAPRAYHFRHDEWVHPLARRTGPPIGFAHRGGRSDRRENTLDAFELALSAGATGLESDAWLSADGEVVLHHDGFTGPLWRRRALSGQRRADLPAHVPTLGELYGRCGTGYELSLDVKDPAAIDRILAVSGAWEATGRVWLCHHDGDLLARWGKLSDDARLVQSTRRSRIAGGIETHAEALRGGGVDVLNLPCHEWTTDAVAAAHAGGVWAFGWDAQRAADIRMLLDMGVDGVYSDHVTRMMAEVARTPI